MIVDINAFFGKIPYWPIPCHTRDQVLAHLAGTGITHPILMSTRGVFVNCQDGNAETLQAVSEIGKDRLHGFTVSPMFQDRVQAEIEIAVKNGAKSIRLFPLNHSFTLKNRAFFEVLCPAALRYGLPIQISYRLFMNWSLGTVPFPEIADVARAYPQNVFIICGPNYLKELEEVQQIMFASDHCCLEISCIRQYGALAGLVKTVGADRLFLGTGFPFQQAAPVVATVMNAEISETDRSKILYANAVRVFHLDEPRELAASPPTT